MITGALEVQKGVDNLWKQGEPYGLKNYPNYGQYIPKKYFKAFREAFPFMWDGKMYHYMKKQDIPWDMFLPFVSKHNGMRKNLCNTIYLMLDKSMSGWRPKNTALGGLPKIIFEPRKLVNLGAMVCNRVECISGLFVHHGIV